MLQIRKIGRTLRAYEGTLDADERRAYLLHPGSVRGGIPRGLQVVLGLFNIHLMVLLGRMLLLVG